MQLSAQTLLEKTNTSKWKFERFFTALLLSVYLHNKIKTGVS